MGSHPHSDSGTCSGRQKAPPIRGTLRALPRELAALKLVKRSAKALALIRATGERPDRRCRPGTTSIFEVGPDVVLSRKPSGDVNQGREMEVLA
jgi:hypothetical protein